MLLVWCFYNKYFVLDYVFCDIVCRFFFRIVLLVAFFCDDSFCKDCIYSCYLCSHCYLIFLPWFYYDIFSCHVLVNCSNGILVHSYPLYDNSTFPCAHISHKSCRYPYIDILHRGSFHLLLNFLLLIVWSFG